MTSIPSTDSNGTRNPATWWLCALLIAAILAAFSPVAGFNFIYIDDNAYIWQNPPVLNGLSWPGVTWAFTRFYDGNWHPLTWLSHMLDVQLFGLNAGAHHLTNVLFHAANSVLLFLWLKRLTGFVWRSAIVAALFALHPLHVESVAWVSERKDVLSTFFLLLSLIAYTKYAQGRSQKSEVRSQNMQGRDSAPISHLPSSSFHPLSSKFYLLSLACFVLGLMSKPMVVTLPFLLLLLDYWPLQRFQVSGFKFQVFLEKIPFFILSAVSCVVTVLAQQSKSAVMPVQFLPVSARLQNVFVSYLHYLEKMVWPGGLAAFYPLSYPIATEAVVLAVFVLVLVTGIVGYGWRSRPYLLVGWLWFLGMLVPVIGLVQVGSQAMADRYTYLPLIGPFIALTWLLADLSAKWSYRRPILTLLSVGVVAACWQLSANQVRYWQNSETLARHALDVTTNNAMMQGLLGSALFEQGQVEPAREHFAEAARIWPDCVTAQCDLALALAKQDRLPEAIAACQTVLQYHPRDVQVHDLLGTLYTRQGNLASAIAAYQTALQIEPERLADLNNLAWLLATAPVAALRDGPEALRLAGQACDLTKYQLPMFVGTLAAAYAEAGRFPEAVATSQKAIDIATRVDNQGLIQKNRQLLESYYRLNKAYHEPAAP